MPSIVLPKQGILVSRNALGRPHKQPEHWFSKISPQSFISVQSLSRRKTESFSPSTHLSNHHLSIHSPIFHRCHESSSIHLLSINAYIQIHTYIYIPAICIYIYLLSIHLSTISTSIHLSSLSMRVCTPVIY